LDETYAEIDELPEGVGQRLAEIETALTAFEERPVRFDPVEIARAGAFVSIDGSGNLRVERGYICPEDETLGSGVRRRRKIQADRRCRSRTRDLLITNLTRMFSGCFQLHAVVRKQGANFIIQLLFSYHRAKSRSQTRKLSLLHLPY
jgi:hypothetical protein